MKRKWFFKILGYVLWLSIAILIGWVLYGFIKEWLAVSSIATLVLAVAAFWAIWQNYSFRRKEKKERLLNEVIEWAIDVNKCGMGHQSKFSQAAVTDPITPEKMFRSLAVMYDLASNIQGEASTLIVRSEHIKNICKEVFNKDLHDIIEKVIAALNKYNNSLLSELDAIPVDTTIKASDMNRITALAIEVNEHKQVVKKLTNELLEKATKIKTRDIT